MLQRDRQIRTQIHQVADACLFAASFWIAFALRANPQIVAWLNLDQIPPDIFSRVVWLYFLLIPRGRWCLNPRAFTTTPSFARAGNSLAALQRLFHHDR